MRNIPLYQPGWNFPLIPSKSEFASHTNWCKFRIQPRSFQPLFYGVVKSSERNCNQSKFIEIIMSLGINQIIFWSFLVNLVVVVFFSIFAVWASVETYRADACPSIRSANLLDIKMWIWRGFFRFGNQFSTITIILECEFHVILVVNTLSKS